MTTPKKPRAGGQGHRRERLRREDLPRSAPIRNLSTLYRRSDSWNLHDPSAPPSIACAASDGSLNDVVSQAVQLGYRVIEDQIRQGQRVAEQLNTRTYDSSAMKGDLRDVAERAWRYYTDLGALWVDFLATMAGNNELMRGLYAAWKPAPCDTPSAASTCEAISATVGAPGDRRAQVTSELRPHSERMTLVCRALSASDPAKPALTDIRFEIATSGPPRVHIQVAKGQPAGEYAGPIFDAATGEQRGNLRVVLSDTKGAA
jgi:hypothetical protein